MYRFTHQQFSRLTQRHAPSAVLLEQLSGAHDQLMVEIENIERITHGPQPESGEITVGRWRISQASLKRRTLAASIHDFLANRLDGADVESVKKVQLADQDMMRLSARHVGAWPIKAISKDWQGYCDASDAIRAHMRTQSCLSGSFSFRCWKSSRNAASNNVYPALPGARMNEGPPKWGSAGLLTKFAPRLCDCACKSSPTAPLLPPA